MGKTVIIFSTITGNAFKLAEAAADVIPNHAGPYNIRYVNDEVIDTFDTFVLAYWCDKGSADPDTIELIATTVDSTVKTEKRTTNLADHLDRAIRMKNQ